MANGDYKLLKDIQPGDEILSWDGNKTVPDKVRNIWQTATRATVETSSYGYPTLTSSFDHKFAITQRRSYNNTDVNKYVYSPVTWSTIGHVHTDQIKHENHGVHCLQYSGPSLAISVTEIKPLEAELVGYCLSSIAYLSCKDINFTTSCRIILERIEDIISQLFNIQGTWKQTGSTYILGYRVITGENRPLFNWIHRLRLHYYHLSHKLPNLLWELSYEALLLAIKSIITVDGTVVLYDSNLINLATDVENNVNLNDSAIIFNHIRYVPWSWYWLLRKLGLRPTVPDSVENSSNVRATTSYSMILHHDNDLYLLLNHHDELIAKDTPSQPHRNRMVHAVLSRINLRTPKTRLDMQDLSTLEAKNGTLSEAITDERKKIEIKKSFFYAIKRNKLCAKNNALKNQNKLLDVQSVLKASVYADLLRKSMVLKSAQNTQKSPDIQRCNVLRKINISATQKINTTCDSVQGGMPLYGDLEVGSFPSGFTEAQNGTISNCHGKVQGLYPAEVNIKASAESKLYDLETEVNGNFFANGWLVHNSGKDIMGWNLCIRQCLRKPCVVFYIFPTYAQAKKVIWDSITTEGLRVLDFIPKELIAKNGLNAQEMKIRFVNGSLLQLVGSDNFDSLMGTNPIACVFSEYALQDPRAYKYLRPILTANDGWALFLSCVGPETLVIGDKGLVRIKDVSRSREEYSDLHKNIWGIGGFHEAEQFYYGGDKEVPTLKIVLENGAEIECTSVHRLWDGSKWVESSDLKVGDLLPLQYGQDVWGDGVKITEVIRQDLMDSASKKPALLSILEGPSHSNDDFFYLLGLFHADGCYSSFSATITKKKDAEIIDFLHSMGFKTAPDGIHHICCSRALCRALEYLGFKHKAVNKSFPDSLLSCTKRQMTSFLQGVFDGDGCSASNPNKKGVVKLTSTSLSFLKTLQVVLSNFGIMGNIRKEFKRPTKIVKVSSIIYNLEITGHFAHVFYRDIGFRLERKQKNWSNICDKLREESGNVYPIDTARLMGYSLPKNLVTNPKRMTRRLISWLNNRHPHPYLQELLSEKLYYSPVASIHYSLSQVFDFVIPRTNSFFSNLFLSHNTPRGKNHLWDLYQVAKESPLWYCSKLTIEDTKHITKEDIERERQEGIMSEDLIQQEYYTDFTLGVEGAYYAKYIDGLKVKGQIGEVPWNPGHRVHTAWDLGIRDSTTIIFFQMIGSNVHIIDTYENTKEGLEHYVKVVFDKPYVYGRHVGPWDLAIREFSTGVARIDKARQLGISFFIAPKMPVIDGIEAVRSLLPRCWFNETTSRPLITALENYHQEFDTKNKIYKDHPAHDYSSHFADSFRYMAISLPKIKQGTTPEELEKRYQETMHPQGYLPSFFRDEP